jgi:chitinase
MSARPARPGTGRRSRRAAGATYVAALAALVAGGCASLAGPPGGRTPPAERVAPYVDVTLGQVPDLAAATAGGVRLFNLAFVTAGAGCDPAWGGVLPHDDPGVGRLVRRVRAAGGDVRVSFGGALPVELALRCADVAGLEAAYRKVLDTWDVVRADFDVEGAALADRGSVHRRNLAVSRLQAAARRAGRPLRVSYTLPVDDAGLTPQARDLLRDARAAGVDVAAVNVMAMNYGTGPGDLVERAGTVAGSTQAFVRELWPQKSERDAWGTVAVTPMVGVNDVAGEVFGLRDAARLVELAHRRGLAWLSFWSMNRDRACDAAATRARDDCSGVAQQEGDFTRTFAGYAGLRE